MDLGAYANIDELESVAVKNGISCPRLRGYRLMKEEDPIDFTQWKADHINAIEYDELNDLCRSNWIPNSHWYTYSHGTDRSVAYYARGRWGDPDRSVRWDRIHGKRKKMLKTAIHNRLVRYKRQFDMWNKYAGEAGILYIHARIGGGNWHYHYKEVVGQPWFIEKVDDAYDSTYCDIYARISR